MTSDFDLERRVLVRGAGGFLGGALARSLATDGARVRLFCRDPGRLSPELLAAGVEMELGDANDPEAVARSLRDVDVVIDAVGATVPATAAHALLPEVELHLRPMAILLDAMVRQPSRKLLFLSSGGALFEDAASGAVSEETRPAPVRAYGAGKWLAEEMIRFRARRQEISSLILRPANVYGRRSPGTKPQGLIDIAVDRALRGLPLDRWGDGSEVRDYLHIDDFVSAVRALLAASGATGEFHLGTGVGSTFDQVVAAVERSTDRRLVVRSHAAFDPGVRKSVVGIEKIRQETGWSPRYSLEEGIAAAVEGQRQRLERESPP